ncbi:MAG TPA: murein biosynthesis integral membrane protein MurJ [Rhodospirillaceae bacterium]|nr:murein biosynthesis integral membrane protein MurJ [Rhodospirillaceae bacterium]
MSFVRSLATVSGLTIVSRIAGFIRDALTAVYLGAGYQSDAFFVAQRLPNLFRSLFAEGAFSAAFVPLYTAEKERNGEETAKRFAGEALGLLIALLTPFTFLLIIGMPWIIRIMAPGFYDEPEKFELAVRLSRITFPFLLLVSITALQTGVLNARGIFGPGATAPILLNIVLILALLIADLMGFETGLTLAWAMLFAGALQTTWLALSCYRARAAVPLLRPKLTTETKRLFKKIGPGAIGAGAAQINLLLTTVLASTLPTGAISFLYYADRLNQLPLGIIGIAVATTLLPILSQHETAGNNKLVRHYVNRAIEFSLLLGLPAAIGLGLAAKPIIQTLFEHGAFTHQDTIETAKALAAYSLGVPAFLLVKVFAARFFARQDTRTPVKIALFSMLVNVTGALILLGPLQHIGMALALSIATWANATLLYITLRKQDQALIDNKLKKRLPRLIFSALIMSSATYLLVFMTQTWFADGALLLKIGGLACIIGLSSLVYFVLLQVTGAFRLKDMIKYTKKD